MKISEIETIVKLMSKNNLTEFKIEASEYNLCIRRGSDVPPNMSVMPAMTSAPAMAAPVAQAPPPQVAEVTPPPSDDSSEVPANYIESPIVGTFYRAPSPEAEEFVKVGDKVTADTVVCIVEAMKVMNEVKAEKAGVIKEILIENASPVEYGQPLFVIE